MKEITKSGEEVLSYIGNLLIFIPFALIFLPSFLIVTYGNNTWNKFLKNLFGL